MHPRVAFDIARLRQADYQREAERDHLAAVTREARRGRVDDAAAQPLWFLRRLLLRFAPSGAGG